MNIEFDVTLQCNFSCLNCNRHSNFNKVKDPTKLDGKEVGFDLYENTDVRMAQVRKFVREVKENGTVERIHLIGGEPLAHPFMDKICTYIRDELYGTHVPNIMIISNIHPKMLKSGTLDTPEEIIQNFPWKVIDKITSFKDMPQVCSQVLVELWKNWQSTKMNLEEWKKLIISNLNSATITYEGTNYGLKSILEGKYKLEKGDPRVYCSFFYGIPVINYKPLSEKAEQHRCTLVAPYDSGQEMIKTCNIPRHCGINYSFDGYWPCSAASSIARLFKMHGKYRKTKLPKSEADWDGVDKDGNATIHDSGMWDVCKLCQIAAKNPMDEKTHGRPISISYRKAMGMEGDEKTADVIVEPHKKKLKRVDVFRKRDK